MVNRAIIPIAFIAPLLVLAGVALAPTFEESSATASVTVNTFVDITVTDRGTSGISFSSVDPGANNNNGTQQNSTHGEVNFKVESTTNKNPTNVKLKASLFNSSGTTFDGNVTADDDNAIDTGSETGSAQIQVATTDTLLKTLAPSSSTEIWYWIDVPSAQAAASYTSTFGFKGD